MKPFKFMGKVFKPFVNFPLWMGWKQIGSSSRDLKNLAKAVFRIKLEKNEEKKPATETFEQTMARLNIDEEKLKERQKQFLKLTLFYFALGLALLSYTIHLFITTHFFLASFVTLILSVLMFTYAYRQHFWYFQIKSRKLGRTFKDWVAFTLKGTK
jgi:intracellular multiplication protein IcmV